MPSETFIRTQVDYLKERYHVFLVGETFFEKQGDFDNLQKVVLDKYEKGIRRFTSKILQRHINQQFRFYNPTQLKRLISKQKIKLIHAHFGSDALKILPVAQKNRVPLVVTFHGVDASKLVANRWYNSKLPELFNYASKIIIVSNHMVESLGLQRWQEKVLLLPCSVNCDVFKSFKRKKSDKIVLLHSGRLVNKKGVPDLIRVFAHLYKTYKNLHLNILGNGPESTLCKKEAEALGVADAVTFLGKQSHEVVKNVLNEADIFVLNSRTSVDGDMEGTPVSILEAMSMQKAVVSTYHAGIPDIIEHNVNGKLVPEKNNELLEEAIRELIEDEEKRMQLGREARKAVLSRFSHEKVLPVLNNALLKIAERKGGTVEPGQKN